MKELFPQKRSQVRIHCETEENKQMIDSSVTVGKLYEIFNLEA